MRVDPIYIPPGRSWERPADAAALRASLYAGAVYMLAAGDASRALARAAWARIEAALGASGPARTAQFRLGIPGLFAQLAPARHALAHEPWARDAARSVLVDAGFEPHRTAFDPPRLRAVCDGGHEVPDAAPVYLAHRDTWYANPRCQINLWLALHDVGAHETFVLYPEMLGRPVENTSAEFNYDTWSVTVGWQRPGGAARATYPGAREPLAHAGPEVTFAARAGELVLFSAAHLHQTRAHSAGATRFSLDLRAVDLPDHAKGAGAPDGDNHSTGSALRDYILPGTP